MTGIYSPTSGEAWVSGNSILTDIQKVQQLIGYCPQFDILWADLTVEEHLRFYSRLKNVDKEIALDIVENTLEDIKLSKFRNFLVKELSGGMKRRLSLGISLVGNPKIVFLDEPTTGLDPENKRQIWEILSRCKENKCMILTTHLMEEAEVLADRIGIIVNGQLKCLGTKFKLKRVYGRGFKLIINLNVSTNWNTHGNINSSNTSENNESNEDFPHEQEKNLNKKEKEFTENSNDAIEFDNKIEKISKLIIEMFPSSQIVENYKSTIVFVISNEEFNAEVLFDRITEMKNECDISNWAISQVSLEDIFIKLTEEDIYT